MNSVIFLYAGFTFTHAFDMVFTHSVAHSSFSRVLDWASKLEAKKIAVAVTPYTEKNVQREIIKKDLEEKCFLITLPVWSTQTLLSSIASFCAKEEADFAIYAKGDSPFLDFDLSKDVIKTHTEFMAEYTFADGYPAGVAPEVIDKGTLNILSSLASKKDKYASDSIYSDSIFNVIREDINSFEIETVIAPKDYRMYRLDFSCSTKDKMLSCVALYNKANEKGISFSAESLSDLALVERDVQKTVPFFYNIQIAENVYSLACYNPYCEAFKLKKGFYPISKENKIPNNMSLNGFSSIIEDISNYSESAVISLSGFTDPLTVSNLSEYVKCVLKKPGLSVLIETDGVLFKAPLAKRIKDIVEDSPERKNALPPVMWIINIDAVTKDMYDKIHKDASNTEQGIDAFTAAKDSVITLTQYFPGNVYPQFVRMQSNEEQLESFYRFYHNPDSPSLGKLIIQKYDSYAGFLSDEKVTDLSPVERIPCWHIKRDMTILPDGSVPLCKEYVLDNIIGNVYNDGVRNVWESVNDCLSCHIKGSYPNKCEKCDEYYTFNF